MAANLWEVGKPISWMDLDCICGRMGACTKGFMMKTRSRGMECIPGLTRRSMRVGGLTGNNMALGSSSPKKGAERWGSGSKGKSAVGFPKKKLSRLRQGRSM